MGGVPIFRVQIYKIFLNPQYKSHKFSNFLEKKEANLTTDKEC